MHGTPKYGGDFTHFSYVNPLAPKGGTLHLGAVGSFDSLNPFIIRGVPARGLGLVYQSLLTRSQDEPFSLYANIAKSFDIAPDRRWINFYLDEKAHFSDGRPIDTEDILFSYETLKTKGRPNHRRYYSTAKAEIFSKTHIRFTFTGDNVWEMPLIIGLMPVLSKSYFLKHRFETTSLRPPVGSGPYRVVTVDTGRRIIYRRDPDYWGWHLPQNSGRYNFDQIIFDYFRDSDVALEAFKSGNLDVRFETDPGKWAAYDHTADARVPPYKKAVRNLSIPAPMKGLVFNTRRDIFTDIQVRKALTLAYDFEWLNHNLLHGAYTRTSSFFQNTDLASIGRASRSENALLSPFRDELPAALLDNPFILPTSDGSGRDRKMLKAAKKLLQQAGWSLSGDTLLHQDSGIDFQFEILVRNTREIRLLAPFQKNLKRLGIQTSIRLLDSAGYQNRLSDFDFDMIVGQWGQSLSPGNEQAFYWSSKAAKTPGSRNYPGITLKSVDHLISLIRDARTRPQLIAATRALDRILLFGHYVIPLYHSSQQWLFHWPQIRLPDKSSYYGTGLDIWWHSPIDARPVKTP